MNSFQFFRSLLQKKLLIKKSRKETKRRRKVEIGPKKRNLPVMVVVVVTL